VKKLDELKTGHNKSIDGQLTTDKVWDICGNDLKVLVDKHGKDLVDKLVTTVVEMNIATKESRERIEKNLEILRKSINESK